jgi:hypothetical protein
MGAAVHLPQQQQSHLSNYHNVHKQLIIGRNGDTEGWMVVPEWLLLAEL